MTTKNVTELEDQDMQQLIVFRLASEYYAIHIDQIKEVVLTPAITKMPKTPEHIRGVANIRGNIIAIVDLALKFQAGQDESDKAGKGNYTLVVESEDMKAGVLVTDVPNTLNVPASVIEDAAGVLTDSRENESYIKGVVKSDDQLILLIDILSVLSDKHLENLPNAG